MLHYTSNRTVEDPRAIAYLKVRLMLEPSGLWLAADSLNVPGQRFSGTVKDNRVEGVFEIEHHRYDGSDAPPFPPDFGSRAELKEFLDTNDMIQSNDPLLAAAAREITLGAKDSWEAVRLLGRWVADNIRGAIPGGITARGTYDQRAGDCGGHSFLLTAFCRSLGIPARVVWGCVHTGNSFGQHGWNEVFMGRAGWIPIDATMSEIDFLDSGHVRIGHYQSLATGLNLRRGEVLEFRLAPAHR
jgi:transglutaminase-like putative cysteine protease